MLLAQSHMKAALKRGGIVWRLSVGTLRLSTITAPPSLFQEFNEVEFSTGRHVEDIVMNEELDLLCGAYECILGTLCCCLIGKY